MKDEIKEILDKLKDIHNFDYSKELDNECNILNESYDIYLSKEETDKLLDYITNLQKENERLKENAIHNDKVVDKAKWNEMLYKSRNEKVLDKIQYIIDYGFDYDGFNTVESLKGLIDMLVDYARQSKDILQGEDKDVKD